MAGNKRMLGIFIIDILSSYASKKKPMTQSEIIDKLDKKYQARWTPATHKIRPNTLPYCCSLTPQHFSNDISIQLH